MKTLLSAVLLTLALGACHHRHGVSPGHDPDGPGNSENAPGHNKR